jgi:membrane associated rhomboid family serine protease
MAFIPIYDTNPLKNIKRPWVAWGLIVVNILVYFLVESGTAGQASDASVTAFGLFPAVFSGVDVSRSALPDVATLITYAFLHADFWHLAGNMIFLWVLADNVEDALGHVRFLVFYLLCAAGAGYAFVLSNPAMTGPVIGASGAIAGTISAYLILHPRAKMWVLAFGRIPLRLSAVYVLSFWIVFQVFAALFASHQDNVAWWSHVGGLICGAVLVLVMRRKNTPLFDLKPVDGSVARPIGSPPTEEPKGPWQ